MEDERTKYITSKYDSIYELYVNKSSDKIPKYYTINPEFIEYIMKKTHTIKFLDYINDFNFSQDIISKLNFSSKYTDSNDIFIILLLELYSDNENETLYKYLISLANIIDINKIHKITHIGHCKNPCKIINIEGDYMYILSILGECYNEALNDIFKIFIKRNYDINNINQYGYNIVIILIIFNNRDFLNIIKDKIDFNKTIDCVNSLYGKDFTIDYKHSGNCKRHTITIPSGRIIDIIAFNKLISTGLREILREYYTLSLPPIYDDIVDNKKKKGKKHKCMIS